MTEEMKEVISFNHPASLHTLILFSCSDDSISDKEFLFQDLHSTFLSLKNSQQNGGILEKSLKLCARLKAESLHLQRAIYPEIPIKINVALYIFTIAYFFEAQLLQYALQKIKVFSVVENCLKNVYFLFTFLYSTGRMWHFVPKGQVPQLRGNICYLF